MAATRMNLLLARSGFAALLQEELQATSGMAGTLIGQDAVAFPEAATLPRFDRTVFARQYLPAALEIPAADPAKAAETVFKRLEVAAQRPNRQAGKWTLHAYGLEDNAANVLAGAIEKQVMAALRTKLPRLHKRHVTPDTFVKEAPGPQDFVVQVFAPSAASVWLSIGSFSAGVSPYVGGILRMRAKEGSPSRSARKLEEAFVELGRQPRAGETAVDLGAAPGGWTFTLARRGATVTAVDALDLALPPGKALNDRVVHLRDNGLKYLAPEPVDWLCCDMIVAGTETLRVLGEWLDKGLMRHFVVNLKLPKSEPWQAVEAAKDLLQRHAWPVMRIRHLFHDRREVTLLGSTEAATT